MSNLTKLFSLIAFSLLLLSNTDADLGNSFEARINTYKYECKQMLKPLRYEGARVTYYGASKEDQTKTVESYLIIDTEYKFVLSGKESSTKVKVSFYDSSDEKKRTLLKELKNIQGKNLAVSSKELSAVFAKKVTKDERLKTIYTEYTITGGNSKNEAIVMVIGYKD